MSFEIFQRPKPGRAASSEMYVQVSSDGAILRLSSGAHSALDYPNHVMLYRDGNAIAFTRAEPTNVSAYGSRRGIISCRRFIREVGLEPGSRIDLRWEDGLLRSDGAG